MALNEDTRVKNPAVLHLCRSGDEYLPLKGASWNIETYFFKEIFTETVMEINPDLEKYYNPSPNKEKTLLKVLSEEEKMKMNLSGIYTFLSYTTTNWEVLSTNLHKL